MQIIKTALCSFGMSGSVFHAPFLQVHPGFELYGAWERSQKVVKHKYPGAKSFSSFQELLADKSIDLVIVNTPNYTHHQFAREALMADKHVLVEKAFTVTVSEAEDLITIAKQKKKLLAVFQNRRYDSDFKTVQSIVENGYLGKITEASIYFDRFNLNPSPKRHKEINHPGSGLLHDLGTHIIDQALCLFGMPVSLFGTIKILRPFSVVNDFFDISLFYPDFNVRVKGSLTIKEPPAAYAVHGLKGSFIKARADIQEDSLKAGLIPDENNWGTEPAEFAGILSLASTPQITLKKISPLKGNYMEFYNRLYEAIRHDKELPVSGEDGLKIVKIIAAVKQSSESGKVITF